MSFEKLVKLIQRNLSTVNGTTTVDTAKVTWLAQVLMPFIEENTDYTAPLLKNLLAIKGIENFSSSAILKKIQEIYQDIIESLYDIKCELRKALPLTQALYIIGFDEIFSEIEDEMERQSLLFNLEKKIVSSILNIQPIFISYNQNTDLQTLLAYTEHHFLISSILVSQGSKESFFAECKAKNIESICVGGVFGDACVWGFTTELAKNIFTRLVPSDSMTHPNIRFNCPFENAVIDGAITEGHFYERRLLPDYLTFTETVSLNTSAEHFESEVRYDSETVLNELKKASEEYLAEQVSKRRYVTDSPIHAAEHAVKKAKNVKAPARPAAAEVPEAMPG